MTGDFFINFWGKISEIYKEVFKDISTQKSYCILTKTESGGKFASGNVGVKGFVKK